LIFFKTNLKLFNWAK